MDFSEQEEFSYAFIHAVAAGAGYSFQPATRQLDNRGVDIIIHAVGENGISKPRPQPLYIQVKSSFQNLTHEKYIHYDLAKSNFENLRSDQWINPFILVIVLLPKEVSERLKITEDRLCLQKSAYWISLKGCNSAVTNKTKKRIKIPRSQQLTVDTLRGIMEGSIPLFHEYKCLEI
jgi:hypothetical protein